MIKRTEKQVYADNTERLLLIDVRLVEHPDVDDDLARFVARLFLKADAQPAM